MRHFGSRRPEVSPSPSACSSPGYLLFDGGDSHATRSNDIATAYSTCSLLSQALHLFTFTISCYSIRILCLRLVNHPRAEYTRFRHSADLVFTLLLNFLWFVMYSIMLAKLNRHCKF